LPDPDRRRSRPVACLAAIAAALTLGACNRMATHESGSLAYPQYDAVGEGGGATYRLSDDRAYEGTQSVKASFDGVSPSVSTAHGIFNVNVPPGYDGYYGAAFYFPVGTLSGSQPRLESRVDILRWNNAGGNPAGDQGGVRIAAGDRRARLIRGNLGTGVVEEIGAPFELQEGCWNWLFVHQKLSNRSATDPDHAVSEVFLNGTRVVDSDAPNNYLGEGVGRIRFGLMSIDGSVQDEPLDVYVDNAYAGADNSRVIPPSANACEPEPRPNVLLVVTDDQRLEGTMEAMPKTTKWFRTGDPATNTSGGTFYPEAVVTTPLCCPARATIFTGRYAHNHEVHTNDETASFADDVPSSLQTYLQQAGYQTGIFGKYLTGIPLEEPPPSWEKFGVFQAGYCPMTVNEQGTVKRYPPAGMYETECRHDAIGEAPDSPYTTSFVRDQALRFLDQASREERPWFLYLAPYAPHENPLAEGKYSVTRYDRNLLPGFTPDPSHNESERSDKPEYVRTWFDSRQIFDHPLNGVTQDGIRTKQLRTLKSVDDMVDAVMRKLEATGEHNTIAFYTSDNGYLWRDHGVAAYDSLGGCTSSTSVACGLTGKVKPYTDSIRVPFFVRWPGRVEEDRVDSSLVANVDIAPTVLDAVGGVTPSEPLDGFSLLGLASRPALLTEHFGVARQGGGWSIPPWASLRTASYQYVENYEQEASPDLATFREFYDLTSDPFQLVNLLADGDPLNDPDVEALSAELSAARSCAGRGEVPGRPPCP
jgi:arylsulfatase A-like enzyme